MFGRKAKLKLDVAMRDITITYLRETLETLTREKADLVDQVHRFQDALISKEAPEAYRDRQYILDSPKVVPEHVVNDLKIMSKYMEELRSDRPAFETADDLIQLVSSARGVPQSRSLHNNDES